MSKYPNICNITVRLSEDEKIFHSISGNSVSVNFAITMNDHIQNEEPEFMKHYKEEVGVYDDYVSLTISYKDEGELDFLPDTNYKIEKYALVLRQEEV